MLDDQPAREPTETDVSWYTSQTMTITVARTASGTVIATAIGEIDMANVDELQTRLPRDPITVPGIVIDLSQITFFTSAALAALAVVRAQCQDGGTPLVLVVPEGNRSVQMPLQVAGMHSLFSIVGTVGEALDGRG